MDLFDYLVPLLFFKVGGLFMIAGALLLGYKFFGGYGLDFYKNKNGDKSRFIYLVKPQKANNNSKLFLLFLIIVLLISGPLVLSIKL